MDKIEKISEDQEGKVSGGIVVAVKPEIAKKWGLGNFNTYLVLDENSRKIIGSYKTEEEAEKNNPGMHKPVLWGTDEDMQRDLYKDNDGDWCIRKTPLEFPPPIYPS